MIPPSVIAPQVLYLRAMVPFVARGDMAWDAVVESALPKALEVVRRTIPNYAEHGLRAQLAHIVNDAVVRYRRAYAQAEQEIRYAMRAMIRGPQAPTDADPDGLRRPTSAELLAEANAINQRHGAPLWADALRCPADEVTEIVQEEVLTALRRQASRRPARRRAA